MESLDRSWKAGGPCSGSGPDLAKPLVETFSADWPLGQVCPVENIVWQHGESGWEWGRLEEARTPLKSLYERTRA